MAKRLSIDDALKRGQAPLKTGDELFGGGGVIARRVKQTQLDKCRGPFANCGPTWFSRVTAVLPPTLGFQFVVAGIAAVIRQFRPILGVGLLGQQTHVFAKGHQAADG